MISDDMTEVPVASPKERVVCLTQSRRGLDQRIKHCLQIEGRAADHFEHVGSGGLLLQRFAQLVEEAHVLDGDYGLPREIGDQLDLLIGEWPDFLAVDADGTDQRAFLEHRNVDDGRDSRRVRRC